MDRPIGREYDKCKDPGHFLGLANESKDGYYISELLKDAVRLSQYALPTSLGLVLMWSTQEDPEHWGYALIRPEGNFFVTAGGSRYAATLYGPIVAEHEAKAGHLMLLRALEELLRSPLMQRSPRFVLTSEMEFIRRLLDPSKGQRTLFGCRLS